MLAAMEGTGRGGDRKSTDKPSIDFAKIGITHKQSSRWQTEAKLDEDEPPMLVPITMMMRWGGG